MRNAISFILLSLLIFSFQSKKRTRDFSNPKSVVETFIEAAKKKDKNTLSVCFSDQSPGEWDALRDKSISRKELKELKEFTRGGTITQVEKKGEESAIVYVTFKSRNEKIHTTKEDDRWYILDF